MHDLAASIINTVLSAYTHSQDRAHNDVIHEQHQYNITAIMMFYTSMGEIHYNKFTPANKMVESVINILIVTKLYKY